MAELFKIAEARGEKRANAIFFHGLGGDARTTWQADENDKATFWLPWLAQDIEGLSVYSVGYEAPVSNWHGSAIELADRAANVLNLLLVKADLGTGEVILAGHSLGGLVIKQLLRKAADAAIDRAEALSFIDRVRKVAFLATPHAGADMAGWGDRLRVLVRPSSATRSLIRNDSHLRDLNLWYRRWARKRGIDHLILTETKTTSMFGMVVKPDSSDPGLATDPVPIDSDHLTIVKPANRESESYQLVRNFILRHAERPVSHEERKIDAVKDETQAIRENVERLTERGPLEKPIDWLSSWQASFARIRRRHGLPATLLLAVLLAGGFVWWNWADIAKRPGVEALIGKVFGLLRSPAPISVATPGHLTIAVAHLARDTGQEHESVLLDGLHDIKGVEGVETISIDRMLDPDVGDRKAAEAAAQELLRETGADVLIWGCVRSFGGKSWMRLYWTPSREVSRAKASGNYEPSIALPEELWSDLKNILGLLTATRLAEVTFGKPGHYTADKLSPLIAQVHTLIESKEGGWDKETLAGVQFSLANALLSFGGQSGKSEPLIESAELYRKVLDEWTRARVPLDWAMTQNNLGNALRVLGERESGTARLEAAAAAFRDALQELTRARVPLQWAGTQGNLGIVLATLGARESGTARLEEAVSAFREALKEFTRDRVPLDWAMTQGNLGDALARLGAREGKTARLEEAVSALRDALKEFTRERVPLDWAMTQMNLGAALARLGERESGTARLEEAVSAFRDALKEFTRERVPLEWAKTQMNLGAALARLGERESGTARLEEAVSAFRDALQENTRERVPLDWAKTQTNLGVTLARLGERESGTARLEEAAAAFREALKEYTRARAPLEWAMIQMNLGATLARLGERESGTARLEEAAAAFREALKEYTRARAPLEWAMIQYNLSLVYRALFDKDHQPRHLDDALEATDAALEEFRKAKADLYIEKTERLREAILAVRDNL